MLDQATIDQLKQVFSELSGNIILKINSIGNDASKELFEMCNDLALTSSKITTEKVESENFGLEIFYNGNPLGINFRAVPGGHEFTSLILVILHADGKGKWPDSTIQNNIKALKGPIHLRTYMSLSCTTCPDIIQSLNQMVILNHNISHEIIDGGLFQEEVESLGLQGVPAVYVGDKLLHAGKADIGKIVEILSKEFGSDEVEVDKTPQTFDAVVIGGGPAGVSSAIYLVRKGLKVAIVADRIGGQVEYTSDIENFISVPKTLGPKLASDLLAHLQEYDVSIFEHRKVEEVIDGDTKTINLNSGECLITNSIIVATGANWRKLGVPGEKEYVAKGVAFCPHCDGPFYKGKKVIVVGGGNSGVEAAIDLAGICSEVTLIEFMNDLKADDILIHNLKRLPNVKIITGASVDEIIGDGKKVVAATITHRHNNIKEQLEVNGIFIQIGLVPNSDFIKEIVDVNNRGEIIIDERCRTSKIGFYAAGDVTTVPYKQIIISMGEGAKAALSLFEDHIRI